MAYVTAAGVRYDSSFAAIIAAIRGTDLLDPVDVACTVEFVEQALEGRVKEELVGTGDLSREYADLRLRGAVRELEMTDRQARHHKAPRLFLAAVQEALREARRALSVAEAFKESRRPKEREPQGWTKKLLPAEEDAPLYTPVTVDDLLAAVNGVGTVGGGE